jgi:hypothetical protein
MNLVSCDCCDKKLLEEYMNYECHNGLIFKIEIPVYNKSGDPCKQVVTICLDCAKNIMEGTLEKVNELRRCKERK